MRRAARPPTHPSKAPATVPSTRAARPCSGQETGYAQARFKIAPLAAPASNDRRVVLIHGSIRTLAPARNTGREDAGCTDLGTLAHLRGHGPRLRGCWVPDRLPGNADAE